MFDGFWAGIFGALTSVRKFEHPTPLIYLVAFLGGAVFAELALFLSVGSSVGFGRAFSLMVEKFFTPLGWGPPLLGGIMGTSPFWFLGSRR